MASGAFDAPKFFEVGGAGVTWMPFICPGQNAFDVEVSRAVSAGGDATRRSVELALCSAFGAGSDPGFVRGRQMRGEPCVIGGAQTASNPPPCCIVVMVWADKGVRDFVEDDATNGVLIIEIGERSGQSDRLCPVDAGSCSAFAVSNLTVQSPSSAPSISMRASFRAIRRSILDRLNQAEDAFRRHLVGRAQLLGEEGDAQFFNQPPHVRDCCSRLRVVRARVSALFGFVQSVEDVVDPVHILQIAIECSGGRSCAFNTHRSGSQIARQVRHHR